MGHHAIVELADNDDELFGATELGHDVSEAVPTDRIERLGQVNEGGVEVLVLLNALLLQLAGGKDHVNRSSTCAEAALALRREVLLQVKKQAIEQNTGQDIPSNGEEGDPAMVVTGLAVSLAFVNMDDDGTSEFLGELFLFPHGLVEAGELS